MRLFLVLTAITCFLFVQIGYSQAPANDSCQLAEVLPVQTDVCTTWTMGNNNSATDSGAGIPSCGSYAGGDVWYEVTVPSSGNVTFDVQNVSWSSAGGTLYSGTCGSLTPLDCTEFNSGWPFEFTGLTAGTYYLRVWDYGNNNFGSFEICASSIACSISSITIGNQSSCAPATSTYTQDITINYVDEPSSGTLDVNGQSFSITSSPQTITLTNLPADGDWVDVNISFSALTACNFSVLNSFKAPPGCIVNDLCANALPAAINPDLTCNIVTAGTTVGAAYDFFPGCPGTNAPDDVWFTFVATSPAHNFAILNIVPVGGTYTDMVHQVFSGSCGSFTTLVCSDPNSSSVSGLTVGMTYYLRVYAYYSLTNRQNFDLCIGTPPPAPPNDSCQGAYVATVNPDQNCGTVVNGTTEWALESMPACLGNANNDVWFTFVATNTSHSFDVLNTVVVSGSSTDMVHEVFSGSCNALVSLGCSDPNSSIVSGLTVGDSYFVRVYSYSSSGAQDFQFCVGTPPPPPANDTCAGAFPILVNPDLSCTVFGSGTTENAVSSLPACAGIANNDVWFSFVATDSTHIFDLFNVVPVSGTSTDMVHEVFSGSCGTLTSLGCSDPDISTINGLTIGNTYYVRVYSYSSTGSQTFDLCIGTYPPPPANDSCNAAIVATVNTDLNCTILTAGSTTSATESLPGCAGTANDDVWFSFVATNANHTFDLLNVNAELGTSTDLVHEVFSGSCGTLTSLSCSDPNSSTLSGLTVGTTYFVRVYSYYTSSSQAFDLCIGTPPPPPVNDTCLGAIPLLIQNNDSCDSLIIGDNTSTTDSGELPAPSCNGYSGGDIWYSVVVPPSGNITIDINNLFWSTTNSTLYSGTCGNLTEVGCTNSNSYPVSYTGLASGTYYLRVFDYSNNDFGPVELCAYAEECSITNLYAGEVVTCDSIANTYTKRILVIYSNEPSLGTLDVNGQSFPITGSPQWVELTGLSIGAGSIDVSASFSVDTTCSFDTLGLFTALTVCAPPPPNDDCFDAEPIPTQADSCTIWTVGDNSTATGGGFNPSCGNFQGGDLWYSVTVPASGILVVDFQNISSSSVAIEITDDCSGEGFISICRDSLTGFPFTFTGLFPGNYNVRVWDPGNDEPGTFEICAYAPPPPPAPGCNNYSSTPGMIIDGSMPHTDTILVSGTGIVLTDLNVIVEIDHEYLGDMEISLVSPSGIVVPLMDEACGSNTNMNIEFDDESTPVACGSPTVGVYSPFGNLSDFDGELFDGNWYLQIDDVYPSSDDGVLLQWCLVPDTSGVSSNSCDAYSSSPGSFISDTAIAYDTITVGGTGLSLLDLNVFVKIDHTYLADLEIILTSPSGTSVTLMQFDCGSNEDLEIEYDDEAIFSALCATPTVGSYIPLDSLSLFDGESFDGDWVISVYDDAGGDEGTLVQWCLIPELGTVCEYTSTPGKTIDEEFIDASNLGPPIVWDTITISGSGSTLSDLNVFVKIDHTYLEDLDIVITSPNGTTVALMLGECGSEEDMEIEFDDEGIPLFCASPTVGIYQPDGLLSDFDGESFDGDWILKIEDTYPGADVGVLIQWCVIPEFDMPTCVLDSITTTAISCNGQSDGSATAFVMGTPSYTYSWSNGDSTATAINLSAGMHFVTVVDMEGCTVIDSIQLIEPSPLGTAVINTTAVSCIGSSDGNATVVVIGGTPFYTYTWDNGETTSTADSLTAGTHSLTVVDMNGCSLVVSPIGVDQPSIMTAIVTTTEVSCNGLSDGTATLISVAGGTPGYSYFWPNGQTGLTATGLAAGMHSVNILDSKGCSLVKSFQIIESPALSISGVSTNVTCNGNIDGSIDLTIAGDTTCSNAAIDLFISEYIEGSSNNKCIELFNGTGAPVNLGTYSISNYVGGNSSPNSTFNLPSVLLANNDVFVICNPNSSASFLNLADTTSGVLSFNGDDAMVLVNNGAFVDIFGNIGCDPGTHWSAGGNETRNMTLVRVPSVNAGIPVDDPMICPFATLATEWVSTQLNDTTGLGNHMFGSSSSNFGYSWSNGSTTEDVSGLSSGTYTVTITDCNGCELVETYSISAPMVLGMDSLTSTGVTCNGLSDGTATITVTGGTPIYGLYTYIWDNGDTTATATGLSAGTHSVTVVDMNGCSLVESMVQISAPTAIGTASVTSTGVSCNGLSDGTATVSITGGTPGYTYTWDNGDTSATATGLSAGTHSITVVDMNGCSFVEGMIQISAPITMSTASVTSTAVSCNGLSDGTATISVTGGTPGYSYTWDNGDTSATSTGLSAGTHNVTVVDMNGCSFVEGMIQISAPVAMEVSVTSTGVNCNGSNDGTATASVSGGTPGYTYSWNNGASTSAITGLTAGMYSVTVVDMSGCSLVEMVQVSAPTGPGLFVFIDTDEVSCGGMTDGAATVTPSYGTAPYSYQWDVNAGNQTTATATGLALGTFMVTVSDANGCSVVDGVLILEEPCDYCQIAENNNTDICAVLTADPTDPLSSLDCDGDGVLNSKECSDGTDPSDPCFFVDGSITEPITADQTDCLNLCADLVIVSTLIPSNIVGPSAISLRINITEINFKDAGPAAITVRMPADPRLTFTWNAAANPDWTYANGSLFHSFTFTGNSGIITGGSTQSILIGLSEGMYDPQNTDGVTSISPSIVPYSGGECTINNNTDPETLVYFR